ncbi:DNA-binding response regulator [Betaproteobacteria bacterium]|nr:DNA-binding response regulator [Betaproteobacteria bacterium]
MNEGLVPLRIAVCEDTDAEAKILLSYIEKSGMRVDITRFVNGESFLEVYKQNAFDLIFLDVYMDKLTGVETAEHIREIDTTVVIVFTTTSDDFTRESYRLNAYKYMLKPIHQEDVIDALELAVIKRDREREASLDILSESNPVSIPFCSIEYVESRRGKSVVVTEDGAEIVTSISLDALEKLLPPPRFLRTHRSYIVNFDHVDDIDEDFIMDNGSIVYIRVKDHNRIKHTYDDYLFNNVRSD